MADGYPLTRKQIDRDVERMFSGNFRRWVGLSGKLVMGDCAIGD